ncbi:MAG: four helix bundle protein [Planctomycetales bacterium]|nr:four helix bundle protein [bacterium]UNM08741.1 MAG: four helix bundle protein [Planctomycetales bacterium]
MTKASHRNLIVWQRAVELVESVYGLTEGFPRREIYGISSQIQRAAVSIPANIAEGNARSTARDYAHFLSMALGSARELDTLLFVSQKLGYVSGRNLADAYRLLDETCRLLYSVRNKVAASMPGNQKG